MKPIRILAAFIIIASMAFSSCVKEKDNGTGIDPDKAKPTEFMYDEIRSDKTSIAVTWNAKAALDDGATGFTVQIVSSINDGGDVYDEKKSKTMNRGDKVFDANTFVGLAEYSRYYVRVRANYPGSVFSEWVYLSLDGEPALHETGTGLLDLKKPTVDKLSYDYSNSTSTSMVLNYDASSAKSANASEVIINIQNKKSTGQSHTNVEEISESSTTFSPLVKGDRFTIRGRTSYSLPDGRKAFSEWFQGKEGEKTTFVVGTGAVEELPPTAKFIWGSSSTLIFSWSNTGFSDKPSDLELNVEAQLYKDEACTDLFVKWTFNGNPKDVISNKPHIFEDRQPCYSFPGLEAGKKYYFKVKNIDTGLTSEAVEGETSPFQCVEITEAKAKAGEIILAEDFSEMTIGGDLVKGAPGFSSPDRGSFTSVVIPTGDQPNSTDGYVPVYAGNEVGLFSTMANSLPPMRLNKWGSVNEGPKNSYVLERPGHLKLGASKYCGHITTPVLSSLESKAKLEISFKAARYSTDPQTCAVYTVAGSSMDANHAVTGTVAPVYSFETPDKTGIWQDYKCVIENVSPSMRIAFGAKREDASQAGKSQARLFIDDIIIKVVSYSGEVIVVETPKNLALNPTPSSIKASWDAVALADAYVIEYKKTAASDWSAPQEITNNSFTITGLDSETSYDVRVKAKQEGFESEYATATVSTLNASVLPPEIGTADELIDWLSRATEASTGESKITADIDLAGKTITSAANFKGVLDGQGHYIKNLVSDVPLFAINSGTIKNIKIEASCKFTPKDLIFGVISAQNNGEILSCINNADVAYKTTDATESILMGGIAGVSNGLLKDCENNGKISIASDKGIAGGAAGIAAYQAAVIENCTNNGEISMTSHYASPKTDVGSLGKAYSCEGGVVAYAGKNFEMKTCKNKGKVSFIQTKIEDVTDDSGKKNRERLLIGGLTGATNGNISGSENSGLIEVSVKTSNGEAWSAAPYIVCVGGIGGGDFYAENQNATNYENCSNKGELRINMDADNANSTTGGITGWPGKEKPDQTVLTKNCSNSGKITINGKGKIRIGGIQGGSGNMEGCTNTGELLIQSSGNKSVAGSLCGFRTQNHTIINCTAGGSVKAECDLEGVGGLTGNQGNAAVKTGAGCKVDCVLTATAATTNIGLVIGKYNGTSKKVEIGAEESKVKVKGTVNGTLVTSENFAEHIAGEKPLHANHIIHAEYGE